MRYALGFALILAASPVSAQVATSNGGAGLSEESAASAALQAPATGVICTEEMTATFCNVLPTAPSNGGYGAGGNSAGSSAPSQAIPVCPEFPPANELCY
jgi:hypothetical protein